MGLFDQIVAAGCGDYLDVLHGVEHGKLSDRRPITPEFVGVDDVRHVVLTQQSSEERSGGFGIPVLLEEDVQHGTLFVNRPPQPMFDATNVHAHFVKMPPGTPMGFPVAQALGEEIAKFDAPRADGLTGHADAPFQQEFFDIAVTQTKPVVEPYGVADDRKGESVAGEPLTVQHRVTLPQQLATTHRTDTGDTARSNPTADC